MSHYRNNPVSSTLAFGISQRETNTDIKSGQRYMACTLSSIPCPRQSNNIAVFASTEASIERTVSRIRAQMPPSFKGGISLLGPAYMNDGVINEFQPTVTGTAKPDETPEQAIMRELAEEMGLEFKPGVNVSSLIVNANTSVEDKVVDTVFHKYRTHHITTFIVNVRQLQCLSLPTLRRFRDVYNKTDYSRITDDGKIHLNKVQLYIFGGSQSIAGLAAQGIVKPIKVDGTFYDTRIEGWAISPLNAVFIGWRYVRNRRVQQNRQVPKTKTSWRSAAASSSE
jgi:hypothetical protein